MKEVCSKSSTGLWGAFVEDQLVDSYVLWRLWHCRHLLQVGKRPLFQVNFLPWIVWYSRERPVVVFFCFFVALCILKRESCLVALKFETRHQSLTFMCVFPKMSSKTSKSARLNFFLQVGWNILQSWFIVTKNTTWAKIRFLFFQVRTNPGKSAEFIDEFWPLKQGSTQ